MNNAFLAYLEKPKLDSFLAVRKQVLEHPSYAPYSEELEELSELVDAEDYEGVLLRLPSVLPNLMLSPRLHLMLAYTHRRLGDNESADMESAVARTCIEGILMTGRGTEEEPWLVLRTSDEYDVLMFIDQRVDEQELIEKNDRMLDRLTCESGKVLWFDITVAYERLDGAHEHE